MAEPSRRVIVTRPAQQARSWSERIAAAGCAQCALPALDIQPVQQAKQQQAIKNAVLKLDEMYALIFVSQNAVHCGFEWIDQYWPQLPQGLLYFAVGQATENLLQEKLQRFGVAAAAASGHFQKMNSEELLQMPLLNAVEGKKIAIFRGVGGRPRLAEVLSERGATVVYVELYERLLPADAEAALQRAAIDPARDIMPVFSGESLNNIHQLLLSAKIADWQNLPLVVPGERVAQIATDLGFKRVAIALNASEDAMWHTTQTCLQAERATQQAQHD